MRLLILIISLFIADYVVAGTLDKSAVEQFMEHMVKSYNYDAGKLKSIFSKARYSNRVLKAISQPAEELPWYKYRLIFLQPDRIQQGIIFWEKYRETLNLAEERYGVPPEIIVAIIGVETRYGRFTGSDKVIDALATLAFHYPKRAEFFRGELEQFLLLTQEQAIDPLSLTGSYAGAMGIPQFIASSYRNYAVDFDGDGKIDIWNNAVDAIGSVANYFNKHGWRSGEKIAVMGQAVNNKYLKVADNKELKPAIKIAEIEQYGIKPKEEISEDLELAILNFENKKDTEIWLGLNNFYVITRYNHSHLYAMAVYQLAGEISKGFREKKVETR